MPAYRIDNLSKQFDQSTALDGVSFEANAGEFVVVLGPTGAGKTTLLRTIAGLEAPSAGRVLADGQDITRESPAARDMAMVFQNFSLYPRLTVYENLAFPLKPRWRGINADEINRRVTWAAELLGITSKLQSRPTELSGGQQQRVAIGRAIVREPRLFLFDEPLASLDAKLRESMAIEIHRLQRRLNVTMLYVTHDQIEAMGLADRIVVLDKGRVLQIGTPQEVYAKPASPRVARMLGSPPINLLTPAEFSSFLGQPPASVGTLGIRPEHITLRTGGPAKVRLVERLGAITVLVLNYAGIDLRVTVGPIVDVKIGDDFTPSVDPGRVLQWGGPI